MEKMYKCNKPVTTKNELENLLKKIDNIEKCSGMFGFVYRKCIGLHYLGVSMDQRFTLTKYLEIVSKKPSCSAAALARLMPNIRGPCQ